MNGSLHRFFLTVVVAGLATMLDFQQLAAQQLMPITEKNSVTWGRTHPLPPPAGRRQLELVEPLRDSEGSFGLQSIGSDGVETIEQRYPDGRVQIKRQVIQSEDGNFYNHGLWQLFNRRSQVLAEGQFDQGLMVDSWRRWHPAGSNGMFSEAPFNEFRGPYLSVATYADGKLHGTWTIFDQYERKILEIPYDSGHRHGVASWYWPGGTKMREISFSNGTLHGSLVQWDRQNRVTRREEYIDGKQVIRKTTWHRRNQKQTEDYFLGPQMRFVAEDDWWNAQPATYELVTREVQHGPTTAWYPNGQLKMKGNFVDGQRDGLFAWWHANGQRQIAGEFRDGKKHGRWTWWYENGIKAVEGNFSDDMPQGIWSWWTIDAELERQEDLSTSNLGGEIETIEPGLLEVLD